MLLYKYTDCNTAFQILTRRKFRYTQPISFNDPFEVSPTSNTEITREFLRPFIQKKFESQKIINFPTDDELNKDMLNITNTLIDLVPRQFGSMTGVFCLSEKCDNLLMWSHYGDSHFGLVIEIDISNNFFRNIKAVNYSAHRPMINLFNLYKLNLSNEDRINYTKEIFFTKSTDWIYELEYRDVKALSQGENTGINGNFGFPIVLFEYPVEIIKGIIFGSKWSEETKNSFCKLLEGTGYNIDYKQATLNKQLFKINIEPFNPK